MDSHIEEGGVHLPPLATIPEDGDGLITGNDIATDSIVQAQEFIIGSDSTPYITADTAETYL